MICSNTYIYTYIYTYDIPITPSTLDPCFPHASSRYFHITVKISVDCYFRTGGSSRVGKGHQTSDRPPKTDNLQPYESALNLA